MFSGITCRTRNLNTIMPLTIDDNGPDWLTRIFIHHSLDFTNKFWSSFPIKTIRMRVPSCPIVVITTGLIQLFRILYTVPRLTPKHYEVFIWALPIKNVARYKMRFPNFWGGVNCVMVRLSAQCLTDFSLLNSRPKIKLQHFEGVLQFAEYWRP